MYGMTRMASHDSPLWLAWAVRRLTASVGTRSLGMSGWRKCHLVIGFPCRSFPRSRFTVLLTFLFFFSFFLSDPSCRTCLTPPLFPSWSSIEAYLALVQTAQPCHLHGRWRRPWLARQLRPPVQVSSDDRREEMRRTPIMMIDAPCRRDGQIGPIMGHTRYLGRDLLNFPTFPPWLPTAT